MQDNLTCTVESKRRKKPRKMTDEEYIRKYGLPPDKVSAKEQEHFEEYGLPSGRKRGA